MGLPVEHLHETMRDVRDVRRRILQQVLSHGTAHPTDLEILRKHATTFQMSLNSKGLHKLVFADGESMEVFPSYLEQIHKDLIFLESGKPDPQALFRWISKGQAHFEKEVDQTVQTLHDTNIHTLISDRDGTLEPYSPFYATAIQSIYSAWFLFQFSSRHQREVILLTSGPLMNMGIVDVNVDPPGTLTYAGSKGRQIFTKNADKIEMELPGDKAKVLAQIEKELRTLLQEESLRKFQLMGSGFQVKYGELAVARNTTQPSIVSESESLAFKEAIEHLVRRVDAKGEIFEIHDTGTDVEILLRVSHESSGFSKGDGLKWLNQRLNLKLEKAPGLLVAGDTASDLPMLETARALNPNTRALFRTSDGTLKSKLLEMDPTTALVSSEDALVFVLHALSKKG